MSVACCASGCLLSFDLTNPSSSQSLDVRRVEDCFAVSDSLFRNYKVISLSLSLSLRLSHADSCNLMIVFPEYGLLGAPAKNKECREGG